MDYKFGRRSYINIINKNKLDKNKLDNIEAR